LRIHLISSSNFQACGHILPAGNAYCSELNFVLHQYPNGVYKQ
jgi:hypothetical protein